MEQIVSPWFIYFLSIINNLISLLIAATVLNIFALIIYWFGILIIKDNDFRTPEQINEDIIKWKNIWSIRKLIHITLPILIILITFIPDKNTLIAMYVADKVTWDKVERIGEVGKDIKNEIKKDILDLIEKLNDYKRNEIGDKQ